MTIHENPPQSTPPGGTFFQGTLPATGRPEPRPPRARFCKKTHPRRKWNSTPRARFCKKTHPRRKWNSTARPPILFAVPVLFFHTRLAVANHLLPAISTAAASAPRPPANQIHSLGRGPRARPFCHFDRAQRAEKSLQGVFPAQPPAKRLGSERPLARSTPLPARPGKSVQMPRDSANMCRRAPSRQLRPRR